MTDRDKALNDLIDVVAVLTLIVEEINPGANEQIRRIAPQIASTELWQKPTMKYDSVCGQSSPPEIPIGQRSNPEQRLACIHQQDRNMAKDRNAYKWRE